MKVGGGAALRVSVEQKYVGCKQGLTEQLSVRQTCWIVFVLRFIVDDLDVEDEMRVGKVERMYCIVFVCKTGPLGRCEVQMRVRLEISY